MTDRQEPSLIEYPCDFPLKIMGPTRAGFAQAVLEIVQRHAPDFDGTTMEMKSSKQGKIPEHYVRNQRNLARPTRCALS